MRAALCKLTDWPRPFWAGSSQTRPGQVGVPHELGGDLPQVRLRLQHPFPASLSACRCCNPGVGVNRSLGDQNTTGGGGTCAVFHRCAAVFGTSPSVPGTRGAFRATGRRSFVQRQRFWEPSRHFWEGSCHFSEGARHCRLGLRRFGERRLRLGMRRGIFPGRARFSGRSSAKIREQAAFFRTEQQAGRGRPRFPGGGTQLPGARHRPPAAQSAGGTLGPEKKAEEMRWVRSQRRENSVHRPAGARPARQSVSPPSR
jgi:hypothetical protein